MTMRSNDVMAILQKADQLLRQGQKDQAFELAFSAPDSPARYRVLISILISRQAPADIKKALKFVDQWKFRDPTSPEPWARLVEIQIFKQDLAAAHRAFKELQNRAANSPNTLFYKGLLLQLNGQTEAAFKALQRYQLSRIPGSPGKTQRTEHLADVLAAMQMCDIARGIHPGTRDRNPLLLLDHPAEMQRLENSLERLEKTIQSGEQPATSQEKEVLGRGWFKLGNASMQADERIRSLQEAIEWNENLEQARENLLFNYNYSSRYSPKEISKAHEEAGRRLSGRISIPHTTPANDPDPDRPLRVGYLSSDFRDHPVASFILPVLQNHDSENVSYYLYYNHQNEDDITALARQGCEKYLQTKSLSDQELSAQIMRDKIDILVDLNGLSDGNRMSLLARRSAPIQVSWIGYPNTTGLETVDYRIVDEITDPRPGAQDLCVEELLYLPRVFSVFQSLTRMPPVKPVSLVGSGLITFGSFNNLVKLDPQVLSAWAEILKRVPDARLVIKDLAMSFEEPQRRLLETFNNMGVEADRIKFLGRDKKKSDHLKRYNEIDICLDSFPYNGTTTSCESLLMGVPVITWAGKDHRSRVTASQLTAVGLDHLVATSKDEYIDIAVTAATDKVMLESSRKDLRERMHASPLMDAEGITRDLEAAYRQVWKRWCDSQASTARG